MNKQEILNELEKMKTILRELKQELNKNVEEWILKEDEEYWYYDKDTNSIKYSRWTNDDYDIIRLKNKVIFKTEEEAQRYADYQKAKEGYSYNFSKEEWEDDNIKKYYIYYGFKSEQLYIDSRLTIKNINEIHFKTENQAQEFIDKYKNEILEYEFGIKEG